VTTSPEGAPTNLESFSINPTALTASLKVPPRTFCPSRGEKIEIQVHARKEQDKVILRLYNSEGNLVHTFFNKVSKGSETILWDGKDESWNTLPPGLYICHLEVIDRQSGKKKTDVAPIVIAVPLKK
jgi:flagellar hook assembly protein FlgD